VIDFDDGPVPGISGNSTYYSGSEPDAPCDFGGCLVIDGPVPSCGYGTAPASMLAVRFTEPWIHSLSIAFRVLASTQYVSPMSVFYASGCQGEYSASLSALAEPEGPFTHASEWTTEGISMCGGPDIENGFVIALGCAPGADVPQMRLVIEFIASDTP
jgi:hypothetical protein